MRFIWVLMMAAFWPMMAPAAEAPAAGMGGYDVRAFGAKGDGTTLDTPAINKAIDAASAAGGGTVRFGAGSYLSTSIHLKSNIHLYLDQGCTLVAAAPAEGVAFDEPEPNPDAKNYQDFGHTHFHNSLIWGEGLVNISITGPGRIWGKGLSNSDRPPVNAGNKSICLKLCRNVTLRDFSFLHGGHFCILATGVDNFTVDNLTFDTNRDGIDVDCCRNVRISNCSVNSPADDAICLKSSFGLGFARATEDVTITNCYVSGFDEGTLLDGTYQRKRGKPGRPMGRIKFGTESNGGFKNITINNCVFEYCHGLALETVDGALLEDVAISNITMRDPQQAPIFIRLGARMRGPKDVAVGQLRRVSINNVVVSGAGPGQGVLISGIPGHAIEDLSLSDIRILYKGGGTKEQAARAVPEKEKDYPEPDSFGELPAYGLFIRHVKGLEMRDVIVGYEKEDLRPAIVLDDVIGADLRHVKAQHAQGVPVISAKNVENLDLHQCKGVQDGHKDKVEQDQF
jgi:hypothetical protein